MNARRFLPGLVAVAVVVPLAIWALLTIRLQTELLPLLPPQLASVRGMALFQSAFSSAQEVTVVLAGEAAGGADGWAAGTAAATRVAERLAELPEVEAVTVLGAERPELWLKSAAWLIANLPPEKFAAAQARLGDEAIAERLARVEEELTGAVSAEDIARAQVDPLGLLEFVPLPGGNGSGAPGGRALPGLTAVTVRARSALRTFEECQRFVDAVRAVAEAAPRPDLLPASGERENNRSSLSLSKGEGQGEGWVAGRDFFITGRPAFVAEASRQMRRDMFRMFSVAVALVAGAFWLFYRSVRALVWILVLQTLAVLTGVIAARVMFGELNVLSIGFAAILLGVGMDYCILVYHFHARGAAGDERQWRLLRRAIWLSAATTAASFGILYFAGFPGLQQLAVLIATGLLATAFFATELEPLFLARKPPQTPRWIGRGSEWLADFVERRRRWIIGVMVASVAAVAVAAPTWRRFSFYDADVKRLRPPHSEAYRGLDLLLHARPGGEALEVIVRGATQAEVEARARQIAPGAVLLPRADFLAANRASWTSGQAARVRAAFAAGGFAADWARTTALVVETLDAWQAGREEFREARAFLSNTTRGADGGWLALVRVPVTESLAATWARVQTAVPEALPANWSLMTTDLGQQARRDFRRLSVAMLAAVVGLCWLAHRSARLVGLNLLALVISVLGLAVLLFVTGTAMTLLSLLAIPLLVGMVIDISLHLVLALEEHDGDLRATFQHMAAPVTLTGLTTMIGFGAPMLTEQPALQNLGFVMDLGILSAVVTGLVLLPAVYTTTHRRPGFSQTLYRAFWFDVGEWLAARLPVGVTRVLGRWVARGYRLTHPRTTRAVRRNLALVRAEVDEALVRRTFANYGETIADYFLLGTRPRAEVLALAEPPVGYEHVRATLAQGKGALLVTAHLGLFEFGSVFAENFDRPPLVVSLPEPSAALSRWRAAYRQRWGAETLEVGEDPFQFVEITRQLAKGRCVALLADRPYGANYVLVDFPNGRVPFSTGPAWLAVLSGSPLVAITTVRLPNGRHRVEAFPPIVPARLNKSREETIELYTRELAAIFRKAICEYPDQWYQFAPLSPR